MLPINVALVSGTGHTDTADVTHVAAALQNQAVRDLAPAYDPRRSTGARYSFTGAVRAPRQIPRGAREAWKAANDAARGRGEREVGELPGAGGNGG